MSLDSPFATSRSILDVDGVDLASKRKYPSIREYYEASSTSDEKPITYQSGLSNYSSLVLGDDRIMAKESVLTSSFRPAELPAKTDAQIRDAQKPGHVRRREYIEAVRVVGWDEVDRMEKNIRDKLRQRSFATSSPFQVRKSFKFFDRESVGTLDQIEFTQALTFLGFEFSDKQILALFARYDTRLIGRIDYMVLYSTCMKRDDDKPNACPDTSHLGDAQSAPSTAPSQPSRTAVSSFEEDELIKLQKAELQRIFSLVDKRRRGYIEEADVELLLLALSINLTPSEINGVLIEIGSSDGLITFDSFFNWWWTSPDRK